MSRFVLMMSTVFRICKSDQQLVKQYMSLFLSFKEFLKILKSSIASLGYSYELLKPILVFLECNMSLFAYDIDTNTKPYITGSNSSNKSYNGGIYQQN